MDKNSEPQISESIEFSGNEFMQECNVPKVSYTLHEKNLLNLKAPRERKTFEKTFKNLTSTSNKKVHAKLLSKKKREFTKTHCPYCTIKVKERDFDKHLSECFRKHEERIEHENKVKRYRRITGEADRYSPETYSKRVYGYLRHINKIHG